MDKKCIIINGQFSYFLYVDKKEIPFETNAAARYFENHYKSLGYKIEKHTRQYGKCIKCNKNELLYDEFCKHCQKKYIMDRGI